MHSKLIVIIWIGLVFTGLAGAEDAPTVTGPNRMPVPVIRLPLQIVEGKHETHRGGIVPDTVALICRGGPLTGEFHCDSPYTFERWDKSPRLDAWCTGRTMNGIVVEKPDLKPTLDMKPPQADFETYVYVTGSHGFYPAAITKIGNEIILELESWIDNAPGSSNHGQSSYVLSLGALAEGMYDLHVHWKKFTRDGGTLYEYTGLQNGKVAFEVHAGVVNVSIPALLTQNLKSTDVPANTGVKYLEPSPKIMDLGLSQGPYKEGLWAGAAEPKAWTQPRPPFGYGNLEGVIQGLKTSRPNLDTYAFLFCPGFSSECALTLREVVCEKKMITLRVEPWIRIFNTYGGLPNGATQKATLSVKLATPSLMIVNMGCLPAGEYRVKVEWNGLENAGAGQFRVNDGIEKGRDFSTTFTCTTESSRNPVTTRQPVATPVPQRTKPEDLTEF